MFSKSEAAQLKKEFWTTLGRLLKHHPSSEGAKVNWINYDTQVKHIYFRMIASNKKATISIEITHKDEDLQALFFEQFEQLKTYLHTILEEEWIWEKEHYNEFGIRSARIYTELDGKTISSRITGQISLHFLSLTSLSSTNFGQTQKKRL